LTFLKPNNEKKITFQIFFLSFPFSKVQTHPKFTPGNSQNTHSPKTVFSSRKPEKVAFLFQGISQSLHSSNDTATHLPQVVLFTTCSL